jgi:hypothetical protein
MRLGCFDGPVLHRTFRRQAVDCGPVLAAEAEHAAHPGKRVVAVRCRDGRRFQG